MIVFVLAAAVVLHGAPATPSPAPPAPATVTVDALHDGSDVDHAIVVTAPNSHLGAAAELNYLLKLKCGTAGGWRITKQSTIETLTGTFDQLDTECSDNSATRSFFFDITAFFGKT
jgi:hypothetical protein